MGTADPPRHGNHGECGPSARQPAIREPRRERGPVRGRGGGALNPGDALQAVAEDNPETVLESEGDHADGLTEGGMGGDPE